jgi:hypothetical protein
MAKKEREFVARGVSIWRDYHVELQVTNELAAGLPKTEKEIEGMLERRMPGKKPVDAIPLEELVAKVSEEVGIDEEGDKEPQWATFPGDEHGLYYEGRCVRGHLNLSGVR